MDKALQTSFALVNPHCVNLFQHESLWVSPAHTGFLSTQANKGTKGEAGATCISRIGIS